MKKTYLNLILIASVVLISCSISKKIGRMAKIDVLENEAFVSAHTGISIYEPATGKYWFNYQGNKYFVPASNTKLPTCYAAMKYLGDSLTGIKYIETTDSLIVIAAGDPTFLHPDFPVQRVFNFLKNTNKPVSLKTSDWNDERWGSGWSWNDYSDDYAPERSAMPIYGNVLRLSGTLNAPVLLPSYFKKRVNIKKDIDKKLYAANVHRGFVENNFFVTSAIAERHYTETPFSTSDSLLANLLADTLHKAISINSAGGYTKNGKEKQLHSQPTDSMLRILMHRSDNFFAEQSLLMVSDKLLGVMNDDMIIDTLLKTDFKDLPQKPHWVDGSGLSHYNLFSPQDFVTILSKIKNEFGMDRIKSILATGGTGTISSYYKADSGLIYAKTGTLSGVVALSGYLYTKKNKLLIFSVLVNNHRTSSTNIRRAVEKFIEEVRNKN